MPHRVDQVLAGILAKEHTMRKPLEFSAAALSSIHAFASSTASRYSRALAVSALMLATTMGAASPASAADVVDPGTFLCGLSEGVRVDRPVIDWDYHQDFYRPYIYTWTAAQGWRGPVYGDGWEYNKDVAPPADVIIVGPDAGWTANYWYVNGQPSAPERYFKVARGSWVVAGYQLYDSVTKQFSSGKDYQFGAGLYQPCQQNV
jgi:hypothetical protein